MYELIIAIHVAFITFWESTLEHIRFQPGGLSGVGPSRFTLDISKRRLRHVVI